ncbi:hypothetical protein [Donghicola sp. XS_ASV15]|uniref:hypothetical protein n=1 Tax=Donghicola sp. XS_ASV15 TaxID=3241295 RepID=UPI0035162A17
MRSVPTDSPIVLPGTLCLETPRLGLTHLLPPIAGTGEPRLVIVLDPVVDPEEQVDVVYMR